VIRIEIDPFPDNADLAALWRAGWGSPAGDYAQTVLPRSLAHLGAYEGPRLVGFVNVAWDGGIHAFILDTVVHPAFRRRGIASDLVRRATEIARDRGAHWLHVDFEPQLEEFYRTCGFPPTAAGLISLK
jgi:GNAT superfamily N-acetyltransferase